MSVVTSPSEPRIAAPTRGRLRLSFIRDSEGSAGVSRLDTLDQRAPLRVLFPRPHDRGMPLAVVVSTSGGLVGGDVLDIQVSVGGGAAALVTTQAAEKVYRSEGATCDIRLDLNAGPESWLEWLPNETIVFDRARLRRKTTVSLAASARLLAGEILVFGRRARGERFSAGLIHDAWEIRRDGRLIWMDAFRLAENVAAIQASPAGLDGAAAVGTIVCCGPRPDRAAAQVRTIAAGLGGPDLRIGVTEIGVTLLVRLLGRDVRALRGAFAEVWAMLRREAGGLAPRLPRLWSI